VKLRRPEVTADEEAEGGLKPSRMRGTETMYGYVVALELLVVSILNLTVTGGKGAPAHPNQALGLAAVVAAVLVFPILTVKSRTIVGVAVIVAGFFVTLPPVPQRLSLAHLFALLFPVIYALVLTQRQRKQANARLKEVRSDRVTEARSARSTARRPAPPVVKSGRYTPPKAKRGGRR
jgi:hypothetical protein